MNAKKSIFFFLILISSFFSCSDYLDIIPDKIAVLDNAFANKNEAEKYLMTCYSYIPSHQDHTGNIGLMGADELWAYYPGSDFSPWMIARGLQNSNDPYMNFWEGRNGGGTLYNAIRDCNIFLENVEVNNKVPDLTSTMRQKWIGEVKFLKAYYYFLLFRMYGPIVIVDQNVDVDAPADEMQKRRSSVDEVVLYISDLLDEAYEYLPQMITNRTEELGHVTKPAALTLKAKLLVTAASPLFNGNPDYADFVDKEGNHLFNADYEQEKWDLAAEACSEAIVSCNLSNVELYRFTSNERLSDTTRIQMNIRNSFSEKWNSEIIWGLSGRAVNTLQSFSMARIDPENLGNMWAAQERLNPTIEIASKFYTDKGVPMNEDKTWDYAGRFDSQTASENERFNLAAGYTTAKLNYHRENRYYASIAFDGSVWYMQNSRSGSDENTFTVKARVGQPQAKLGAYNYSVTGYWPKKLINWKFVLSSNSSTTEWFPWPELRLADLYLLYAEALNECDLQNEAIDWIDLIRERAGLEGVAYSWDNYSTKPDKYKTKDGLREIIHQERTVELVFEGQRFWDIRRWKSAAEELNQKIHGWDIDQETPEAYYRPRVLFDQEFKSPRDYLWPLREEALYLNEKLVQNPGW